MGKTIMGAIVSLDGFIADDDDGVGPLSDWLENPTTIVQGDRVTDLLYDVRRRGLIRRRLRSSASSFSFFIRHEHLEPILPPSEERIVGSDLLEAATRRERDVAERWIDVPEGQ